MRISLLCALRTAGDSWTILYYLPLLLFPPLFPGYYLHFNAVCDNLIACKSMSYIFAVWYIFCCIRKRQSFPVLVALDALI
jgi:hypothetical protein